MRLFLHMSIVRVSVSEAARLFGVSTKTIQRAITAGEITYVVIGGKYKINFESLVKWSQKRATTRNKFESNGIGQYVEKWRIRNRLYTPNPKSLELPPKRPRGRPRKDARMSGFHDPSNGTDPAA